MKTMTLELYDVAVALTGNWRGGYLPKPYRLTGPVPHVLPRRSKAVYVVADGSGIIRYVGSVSRTRSTAIRERTAEHVRCWLKERNWATIYVVPLDPKTPSAVVKALEGRIGRRLKPTDNRRLPAPTFP